MRRLARIVQRRFSFANTNTNQTIFDQYDQENETFNKQNYKFLKHFKFSFENQIAKEKTISPKNINEMLNNGVIGQNKAKKVK